MTRLVALAVALVVAFLAGAVAEASYQWNRWEEPA